MPHDTAKTRAPQGVFPYLSRRDALQWGATSLTGAAATFPAEGHAPEVAPSYTQTVGDGQLHIYAISNRAIRVRFAKDGVLPPSPTLLSHKVVPLAGQARTKDSVTLDLRQIKCRIKTSDGTLSFFDAAGKPLLRELPDARHLVSSTVQGEATFIATQEFHSPSDERLYGTGQFQDGFLNLRGLSRRLTQVNTQISLPFLLSSKGYGLLWHNAGMVELNPGDRTVVPDRVAYDAKSAAVNVTTTAGTANITRNLAAFEGTFDVPQSGRYSFLLDVGQAMANKHYVEIDGKVLTDVASLWLPPTTSFFAELATGLHKLKIIGDAKDRPSLRFALVRDATVLCSPVADAIDYVVIAGPSAEDIIAEYRRLTGHAPMMPKWAYGYIHCRERYKSSEEILANVREFRSRKIPMDVIVQDWQYWGKYGWNAMRFDEADYPDPAGLIASLHSMKTRFMLSVWSKVDQQSDLGKSLAARGCFIPDTTWIDFFDKRAAGLYWGAMSHQLLSLGVDAWWQDATEPENDDLVGRKTAAGIGNKVRLQYPLEVSRTVYEGQRRDAPDRRVMILTRSAFPGQQRFASATWSGDIGCDWDTLKRQIPAGLNMMAAGYPYWTVDAGGFFRPGNSQYTDPAYHELFIRWLQYATFLPLMRVHGYQSQTEPWRYGEDVERRARALIEWRYRLLPYIYSNAAAVTRKGSSLMRPLVMDFADDAKALDQTHSYMFGKALHIAPVFRAGVSQWDVYLPQTKGGWYDFWTGEHRDAGATHVVDAPLDRVPVHARAGSILPIGPVVQSTADGDGRGITLKVFAGSDGTFDLYEDEGTNYRYEKGKFSTIRVHWNNKARTLSLATRSGSFRGMLDHRTFEVELVERNVPPKTISTIQYDGGPRTVML
jgi:alpha-D-xyloside xylohydrolase